MKKIEKITHYLETNKKVNALLWIALIAFFVFNYISFSTLNSDNSEEYFLCFYEYTVNLRIYDFDDKGLDKNENSNNIFKLIKLFVLFMGVILFILSKSGHHFFKNYTYTILTILFLFVTFFVYNLDSYVYWYELLNNFYSEHPINIFYVSYAFFSKLIVISTLFVLFIYRKKLNINILLLLLGVHILVINYYLLMFDLKHFFRCGFDAVYDLAFDFRKTIKYLLRSGYIFIYFIVGILIILNKKAILFIFSIINYSAIVCFLIKLLQIIVDQNSLVGKILPLKIEFIPDYAMFLLIPFTYLTFSFECYPFIYFVYFALFYFLKFESINIIKDFSLKWFSLKTKQKIVKPYD